MSTMQMDLEKVLLHLDNAMLYDNQITIKPFIGIPLPMFC